MNLSSKHTNVSQSRENSSLAESLDEEKDIIVEPIYEPIEGELPHLGNYKRPIGSRKLFEDKEDGKLVLNRRNENTIASTAGLFFMAMVMCILCLTSMTLTGDGQVGAKTGVKTNGQKEVILDNYSRNLSIIQDKEEKSYSLIMWMIFMLSLVMAYFTRITIQEGKLIFRRVMIKCHIIKDPSKKTKSS
jgi:hypothetical protein